MATCCQNMDLNMCAQLISCFFLSSFNFCNQYSLCLVATWNLLVVVDPGPLLPRHVYSSDTVNKGPDIKSYI